MVEPDHLHRTHFKPAAEDDVHDLSNLLGLDCMRLDDAEGAVLVIGSGTHHSLAGEDEVDLSFGRRGGITAVAGILRPVFPIECPQ